MSGVNLQAIYNRLNSVPRYHPMSAKTFADWSMEAGDIVTVSRGGTSYQSPVGTSTLKWSGKQQIQISTEGSRERDAISRISARKYAKGGGGGSGMRGTQELYWEMFSEDGQLHAVISATAQSLTADYTKKIGDVDDALEGKIAVTAEQLRTEYTDRINNTQTQINQNASTLSLAVGRVKYSGTAHYANKSSFPASGTAGVLYYADDTGYAYLYMPGTHSYERATADEFGNANFLKAGEIAISINESGQTAAKLDADVIYAGRGSTTIADLELPDWMDTTTGLIATKATIVDLNALRARVGTLEADTVKTANLASEIGKITLLTVNALSVQGGTNLSGTLTVGGAARFSSIAFGSSVGATNFSDCLINASVSNNVLTLTKASGGTVTFSKATSLSGVWSGNRLTVTATPQNVEWSQALTKGTATWSESVLNLPVLYYTTDSTRPLGTAATLDVTNIYNDGYDAVGSPSISVSAIGSSSSAGSISGTASVANKSTGATRRTSFSLSLSKSTYNPGGTTVPQHCVNAYYGSTLVGRIDTQSHYSEGRNSVTVSAYQSGGTMYAEASNGQIDSAEIDGYHPNPVRNAKGGLTQLADASGSTSNQFTLYGLRNGSYYSVGSHFWFYASSKGTTTYYE